MLVIISLRPILFVVDETIEMDEFQTKAAEDGERAVTAGGQPEELLTAIS